MCRDARILIIEDDGFEAQAIKSYFDVENSGYVVVGVTDNAKNAKELITDLKPDIIVLDFTLKGSMGTDVIKWVRGNENTSKIYILIFCALMDRGKQEALSDMGANEILIKGSVEHNPSMIYRHLNDFYPYYLKETNQEARLKVPVVTKTEEKSRLNNRIATDLEGMGITIDYEGRNHIIHIIQKSVAAKNMKPRLDDFYKEIAYEEVCAASTVHKRIEFAIEVAFRPQFYETTRKIYTPEIGTRRCKPTNSQFMYFFINKYICEGY